MFNFYVLLLVMLTTRNVYSMERVLQEDASHERVPSLALTGVTVETDAVTSQERSLTTERMILQELLKREEKKREEKRRTEQRDALVDSIEPHFYDALRLADTTENARLRAQIKQLRAEAAEKQADEERKKLIKDRLKRMSGVDGLSISDLAQHAKNLRAGIDEIYQGRLGDPDKPIDEQSFKELAYQCVLARSKSAPRKRSEKQQKFLQRKDFLNRWFERLDPEVVQEIMGVYQEATSDSEKSSSQRDVVPSIVSALMNIENKRAINPDQLSGLMEQLVTEHLEKKGETNKTWFIRMAVAAVVLLAGNVGQALGWNIGNGA